ncbi:unnamed protein product [Dibothriocephalus latus]|uniref:Uncharacterized protein n=1 Tax=Dibothriocephalus latus TaxID=60516 RepID=A0A3P6TJX9_DIBLA|nr:unnamed protein product [Dibothriocephalus latus]
MIMRLKIAKMWKLAFTLLLFMSLLLQDKTIGATPIAREAEGNKDNLLQENEGSTRGTTLESADDNSFITEDPNLPENGGSTTGSTPAVDGGNSEVLNDQENGGSTTGSTPAGDDSNSEVLHDQENGGSTTGSTPAGNDSNSEVSHDQDNGSSTTGSTPAGNDGNSEVSQDQDNGGSTTGSTPAGNGGSGDPGNDNQAQFGVGILGTDDAMKGATSVFVDGTTHERNELLLVFTGTNIVYKLCEGKAVVS